MSIDDLTAAAVGIFCLSWGAWGIYWARRDGLVHGEMGVLDRDVDPVPFKFELVGRYAALALGLGAILKALSPLL